MRLFGFLNGKSELARALCISASLHLGLLGFLIFGPKNIAITPPALAGMNLVWVSLGSDTGQGGMSAATSSGSKHQASGEKSSAAHRFVHAVYATPGITRTSRASDSIGQTDTNVGSPARAGLADGGNYSALTAYPVYGENMPPAYPEVARLRGYEGIVLIAAEILPNGRVGEAKIKKSSGYAVLDQSALDAVKPWRFEPAKKAGQPFTMWVEVPIKFVLQKDRTSS